MLKNTNKLGPSLKMRLFDDSEVTPEMLNLFVQIKGEDIDIFRDQLGDLDVKVRTQAGDVLTVNLPSDQLQRLAALDSVIYIELSRPLSKEN